MHAPWASSVRSPSCPVIFKVFANTMPLHVEILYNEYNYTAAFAVASLLALLALLTLAGKSFLEWRQPELRRSALTKHRSRTDRRTDPP